MDQIIHSINAVGFPIVAFLLIFWQGNTIIRANTMTHFILENSVSAKVFNTINAKPFTYATLFNNNFQISHISTPHMYS